MKLRSRGPFIWWFWPALFVVVPLTIWGAHTSKRREFIHSCVGAVSAKDDAVTIRRRTELCAALWEVQ